MELKIENRIMESFLENKPSKLHFAIFVIWLFQVSGMIGIALGYGDWFLSKTPLNLSIFLLVTVLFFPILDRKTALVGSIFFLAGMLVEWIGVHYEFLFGSYYYGENLGWKIDGVPLLIGVNWMILTLITGCISTYFFDKKIIRIIAASTLMIFLDFFMEVAAPPFDFWIWEEEVAPLRNYIAWFGIALVLHTIYQFANIRGNLKLSAHLYLAQLVFFAFFYFFLS